MWYVKLPESIFLKSENIGLDRPQKSPGAACSGASKKPAAWGAGPGNPHGLPETPGASWSQVGLTEARRVQEARGRGSGWVAVGCCFSAEAFWPRADGGFHGISCDCHGLWWDVTGFNHHQEFGLHGSVNGWFLLSIYGNIRGENHDEASNYWRNDIFRQTQYMALWGVHDEKEG